MARLKVAGSHADHRQPAGAAGADPRRGNREGAPQVWAAATREQEEAWEMLTRGIVNKIAHGPISELRQHAGQPEGAQVIAAIRKAVSSARLDDMLVIGSRGSQLALWQARWVRAATGRAWGTKPHRDHQNHRRQDHRRAARPRVGGKGLFTKEIEEALLDGRADLAVHSLKDLPTELPDGLTLAAVPEREDPRDAIVGQRLADLPRARGSAPVRCGAPRSCARCGPICASNRCAATSTRGCASWTRANTMPSCWRPRD